MCPCNKIEKYRKELSERKAKYKLETEKDRKEAKERLAKKKLEKGTCLDLDDIQYMSKQKRIRLAKYMCNTKFR